MSSYGTLTAVGMGPGDPELLTLKGLRLLRAAEIVVAPLRAEGATSYALEIAWPHLELSRQRVVSLLYPMRQGGSPDAEQWRFNARSIARELAAGADGAFICEGDPLLYSTFAPTLLALQDEFPALPVQVVPGISSVTAAAALAHLPLARLEERVAIVPATAPESEVRAALESFQTVILLKVAARFDRLLDLLEACGRAETAVLAERVGTPNERVERDLRALRGQRLDYFSLVVVHGG
jgi:precorrin-2/cobalt-factor-2 C20-methyltransferase